MNSGRTRGREARNCGARKRSDVMSKKKAPAMMEFRTVKRIDNSRLVRHVEPAKQKNLFKTAGLGGVVALFFLLYIFQHFKCIDLSFQLEDLKVQRAQATQLNSELKLEIANLRDPMRIDMIARRQLGLTEPLPTQMREYEAPSGMQVASARFVRRGQQQ